MSLIIPLATMALSAAGSAYGMTQANKAQKESEAYNKSRIQQAKSFFNNEYYQDFMNSDIARGGLEKLSKRFRQQTEGLANSAAAGGSTPEQVIANSNQLQDQMNDAVLSFSQQGMQWKDQIKNNFDRSMIPLQNYDQSIMESKVGMWQNLQDSIGDASAGMLNAWAYGAFDGSGGGGGLNPDGTPIVKNGKRLRMFGTTL
jgi:hypothetical protein